jgi:hypothetical protein
MMLVDAHRIKHRAFGMDDLVDFLIGYIFTQESLDEHPSRSKNMSLAISYLFFGSLSRSEISGPIVLRVVTVWEHIVIAYWPFNILILESFEVMAWSRIEDRDVGGVVLVEVLNDEIHLIEVQLSIRKGKITSEWDHNMVSSVDIGKFVNIILQLL